MESFYTLLDSLPSDWHLSCVQLSLKRSHGGGKCSDRHGSQSSLMEQTSDWQAMANGFSSSNKSPRPTTSGNGSWSWWAFRDPGSYLKARYTRRSLSSTTSCTWTELHTHQIPIRLPGTCTQSHYYWDTLSVEFQNNWIFSKVTVHCRLLGPVLVTICQSSQRHFITTLLSWTGKSYDTTRRKGSHSGRRVRRRVILHQGWDFRLL